jgi:hypothetical protein
VASICQILGLIPQHLILLLQLSYLKLVLLYDFLEESYLIHDDLVGILLDLIDLTNFHVEGLIDKNELLNFGD